MEQKPKGKKKPVSGSIQGDKPKVGDKSPPVETRFQPGKSGNPKGKPKGKNYKTILNELLDLIPKNDKLQNFGQQLYGGGKRSNRELMAAGQIIKAIKGNDRNYLAVMSYAEGKPIERMHVETSTGTSLKQLVEKGLVVGPQKKEK